jgi:hypothetical protein
MCALKDDGTVWCWGVGTWGLPEAEWQCIPVIGQPHAFTATPVRIEGIERAVAIISRESCSVCAVIADGHVRCAGIVPGYGLHLRGFELPGFEHVISYAGCAVRDDFSITCGPTGPTIDWQ